MPRSRSRRIAERNQAAGIPGAQAHLAALNQREVARNQARRARNQPHAPAISLSGSNFPPTHPAVPPPAAIHPALVPTADALPAAAAIDDDKDKAENTIPAAAAVNDDKDKDEGEDEDGADNAVPAATAAAVADEDDEDDEDDDNAPGARINYGDFSENCCTTRSTGTKSSGCIYLWGTLKREGDDVVSSHNGGGGSPRALLANVPPSFSGDIRPFTSFCGFGRPWIILKDTSPNTITAMQPGRLLTFAELFPGADGQRHTATSARASQQ
ncbi:uncharacterized protein J3D65DRAFT_602909 [Phyllosticta citribraziliensis]|uniref:Uncharacterized protein n=1 Tax=Phyllosticta citribraziliensis TaxID=989973 RepID=A0ABR1LQ76_9PEZI